MSANKGIAHVDADAMLCERSNVLVTMRHENEFEPCSPVTDRRGSNAKTTAHIDFAVICGEVKKLSAEPRMLLHSSVDRSGKSNAHVVSDEILCEAALYDEVNAQQRVTTIPGHFKK